ncbi:hypothetical protein PISMIDRAFT_121224, partial [Pisolithus microcarpus 441]
LYMNKIAEEAPDLNMLMFVDEAARGECMISRRFGCSGRCTHCAIQRWFVWGMQYSIIPAITLNGIIAYNIVEGTVDAERFLKFLKEQVMPFTNPYPSPCSILIMDNFHIHHGEEVHKLVENDHHKCYGLRLNVMGLQYLTLDE